MFGILWEYTYFVHSLPHKRVKKSSLRDIFVIRQYNEMSSIGGTTCKWFPAK